MLKIIKPLALVTALIFGIIFCVKAMRPSAQAAVIEIGRTYTCVNTVSNTVFSNCQWTNAGTTNPQICMGVCQAVSYSGGCGQCSAINGPLQWKDCTNNFQIQKFTQTASCIVVVTTNQPHAVATNWGYCVCPSQFPNPPVITWITNCGCAL